MNRVSTGRLSSDADLASVIAMEPRDYLNHCAPTPEAAVGAGCNAAAPSRVLSRNSNGTIAMTSQPTNESELQLYRVLQRANLLSYYDTFIGQGGDDVQQLCEAGEEEFLEIMALVGMATKPLHVRRLQKALQEWVNNPAMFQTPLVPSLPGLPMAMARPMNLSQHNHLPPSRPSPPMPMLPNNHPPSPSLLAKETAPSPPSATQLPPLPPPPPMSQANGATPEKDKQDSCPPFYLFFKGSEHSSGGGDYGQPGSPLQLTPVLVECQIQRLSEAAEMVMKALPPFEPKPQNSKKKICKELEYVIGMAEDDPRRMDEIRKYAAIYGRFDCKRKPEKPLTLHEVSVNEAAAQICRHIPALLTRRDELFPLARQVVRDSGYQYSKGHSSLFDHNQPPEEMQNSGLRSWGDNSRSQSYNPRSYNNCDDPGGKRARLDQSSPDSNCKMSSEMGRMKRQERIECIHDELKQVGLQQEELRARLTQARDAQDFPIAQQIQQQLELLNGQQVQLIAEQSELAKRTRQSRYYNSKGNGRMSSCSDPERPETDDTDSQYSFSNTSSPCQDVHDSSSQDNYPLPTPPGGGPGSGGGGNGSGVGLAPQPNVHLQVQDMFPMTKSVGGSGGGGGQSGAGVGSGGPGVSKKSSAAHITKQMMQETLMDEGLRVVKELSSQIKEDPDGLVMSGGSGHLPMHPSASPGPSPLSPGPSRHHHHHHHHHHNPHHHQHHHQQHHQPSPQHHHVAMQSFRYAYGGMPPGVVSSGNHSSSSNSNGPNGGGNGGNSSNGATNGGRERDCRSNGTASVTPTGMSGSVPLPLQPPPPLDSGAAPAPVVNDVEKAAASTINALLSLSQNAGNGRGLKQELPSPPCSKSD